MRRSLVTECPPPARFRRRVRSRSRSSRLRDTALADSLLDAAGWRRGGSDSQHAMANAIRIRSPHRWQRRQRARAARSSRPRRTRHPRPHSAGGARHVSHPGARREQTIRRARRRLSGRRRAALSGVDVRDATSGRGARLRRLSLGAPRLAVRRDAQRAHRSRASRRVAPPCSDCSPSSARRLDLPLARRAGRLGAASQRRDGSARRDGRRSRRLGRTRRRAMSLFCCDDGASASARRRRRGRCAARRFAGRAISSRCCHARALFPGRKGAAVARRRALCARRHAARVRSVQADTSTAARVRRGVSRRAARSLLDLLVPALARRARHPRGGAASRSGVDDRVRRARDIDSRRATSSVYATYPNVDNVLGPTRLFFSTYLESIWLLQICVATDLLDATQPVARARECATASSSRVARSSPSTTRALRTGRSGTTSRFSRGDACSATTRARRERACSARRASSRTSATGLLADGTWYEGENYHLFAHRGLWYGVTMAEARRRRAAGRARRSVSARVRRAVR